VLLHELIHTQIGIKRVLEKVQDRGSPQTSHSRSKTAESVDLFRAVC
jgi:hypothetical protein